jgi:hypothetical protein
MADKVQPNKELKFLLFPPSFSKEKILHFALQTPSFDQYGATSAFDVNRLPLFFINSQYPIISYTSFDVSRALHQLETLHK